MRMAGWKAAVAVLVGVMAVLPGGGALAEASDDSGSLPPVELRDDERPGVPGLDSIRCFDAPFGWVFCDDEAQADEIAADLREAAMLFHRHFGTLPRRGAVVAVMDVPGEVMGQLKVAGAAWVMPWVPSDVLEGVDLDDEMRRQIEEQLREQGIAEGMIEMIAEQALDQVRAQIGDGRGIAGVLAQTRPLTHELGHFWFGELVWGESWMDVEAGEVAPGAHRYGSRSPEWLDEVGAILLENEALTAQRHDEMRDMLAGDGSRVIPLAELFTMVHPGLEEGAADEGEGEKAAEGKGPRGITVRVRPTVRIGGGEEDAEEEEASDLASDFYAQCRSLAEFMIERSGRVRLFADLAMDLKSDPSMDRWLRERGEEFRLPGNVEALEEAWRKWAMKRYLGNL